MTTGKTTKIPILGTLEVDYKYNPIKLGAEFLARAILKDFEEQLLGYYE